MEMKLLSARNEWTCVIFIVTLCLSYHPCASDCGTRFIAPKAAPLHANDLNGIALPDVCFNQTGPHHIFVIGDWGGILPGVGENTGPAVKPADTTKPSFPHARPFVWGVDDSAQLRVASQFKARALGSKPEYIINVGDNFYWAGVEAHCGSPPFQHTDTGQWQTIFEAVYNGLEVDGKQWLGVLGNHDYGGWKFTGAWDQAIGYTWGGPGSTDRWVVPAQYWSVKVHYSDFSIDYYFTDSNYFDAHDPNDSNGHNMCSFIHNTDRPTCGPQGPVSPSDCPAWFAKLWGKEVAWLEENLPKSTANWQIIVTHFPPAWGATDWLRLSKKHGIDLFITGHKHTQEVHYLGMERKLFWPGLYDDFLGETAWIVSGGGGGVTSEQMPDIGGNDDQYGFMDLTLMKTEIKIEAISHAGQVRSTTIIHPRVASYQTSAPPETTVPPETTAAPETTTLPGTTALAAAGVPDAVPGVVPGAVPALSAAPDAVPVPGAAPDAVPGCKTIQKTFYMYRAQNDENYPVLNMNAADLAGVLWYLHHEVVIVCPRKFGITRIRRLKVTMRNTCDVFNAEHTQFGPYVAFDSGQCTVPGCDQIWQKYGPVVGCQHIPYNTGIFAAYCSPPKCRRGHWYSLPAGSCGSPTGIRDCTFSVEEAGEVRLSQLYPLGDMNQFCAAGKMEYNNKTDQGIGFGFWNGIYDPVKCMQRYNTIQAKFQANFPDMPLTLDEPDCDWFKSDPGTYLHSTGSGFPRPTVV